MKKKIILSIILCSIQILSGLPLDRAIISTDANPNYIQFWPVVAKAWEKVIGIRPTLALIADDNVIIEESLGDVIRFRPDPDIPTAFFAQCVRLFMPCLFPNDVCITSDIDMIPLNKEYFFDSIKNVPDDYFVAYRKFSICYNAAFGKVFAEIFNVHSIEDIYERIREWYALKIGWWTDERMLRLTVTDWNKKTSRCAKLEHGVSGRIDRSNWRHSGDKILKRQYIDAHCPRPYSRHKASIDRIINLALESYSIE